MYYLGGMTVSAIGWINPTVIYVDFVSQFTDGWLWQLYSNKSLIGCTRIPSERRVVGQIVAAALPAPLTLVRVDSANILTDYSAFLPAGAWSRYRLNWTTSGMSADTDHFDVVEGDAPGGAIDVANILARVPFTADGNYTFELPPFEQNGNWAVGIVPRDNAIPLGNAGATSSQTVTVLACPPDVQFDSNGRRLQVSIAAGVATVTFAF